MRWSWRNEPRSEQTQLWTFTRDLALPGSSPPFMWETEVGRSSIPACYGVTPFAAFKNGAGEAYTPLLPIQAAKVHLLPQSFISRSGCAVWPEGWI